jgi:hypothetical protein
MMGTTQLAQPGDDVETWVQNLDGPAVGRALAEYGLWSPADGADPTGDVEAAYRLARRALGLERTAITFRAEGHALLCRFVYADRPVTAVGRSYALALTRAILRAAYESRLI